MLVNFDRSYQIRELYFPHVGQENHVGHVACRFGVHADSPNADGSGAGRLAWTQDGFAIRSRYLRDSLTTSVSLEHPDLKVSLYCNDVVDFHRRVFVRRIKVRNLADRARTIRLVHHQAWQIGGLNIGDTVYFDPDLQSIIHYRGQRYISATFFDGDGNQKLDEFATGRSGFGGAEGTWRDAEDGHLQGNTIAQGAVDSCAAHHVRLEAKGEATCYLAIICGQSREEIQELHEWLARQTPQGVIDRTTSYWRLWVSGAKINFGDLPKPYVDLFKRSLLTVRTNTDDSGAILAANDGDITAFSRDTYSYVWPRDGALVADALDSAGFPMLSRRFFEFCQRTITPEGYLHHKYNPDGSVASSWHPLMTKEGVRQLPIQEDETALVVWALWRHFQRQRDTEFVRPMWVDVVQPAADFMVEFRDEITKLPLPSWDLWEERWGVHAFTVATVYAGLRGAQGFAVSFGDTERALRYGKAADEIRAAAEKHLFCPKLGRFVRRLVPKATPAGESVQGGSPYEIDDNIDASLWSLSHFGMFPPDDVRIEQTMEAVESRLWVKTAVGGLARYERDEYQRVSNDTDPVPGNPWFICTLWLADYRIACATTPAQLKRAVPILDWVAAHAAESGVLAEQVHPHTNAPLSVAPLTWSHAQVVSTAISYLAKLESLSSCGSCRQPLFRLRGDVEPASGIPREMLVTAANVGLQTLSIHVPDCIGCGVCVTSCERNVLGMQDGKAMIDLRQLQQCDLDGNCINVCPTACIKIKGKQSEAA
jgi:GH15 family glucan-1,4-alpha-glucosidase/NAD-dependent dihydropyrimidine dehydrogenase PreA subunit